MSTHSFLLWTTSADGHVAPGLPIARRLVERGHDVRWYAAAEYRGRIEATGARFAPMVAAVDPGRVPLDERLPGRAGLEGLAGLKYDLKHLFLDEAPAQIADVRRLLAEQPADVVLVDTGVLGAPLLGELTGQPWATFGISVLTAGGRDVAPFGLGLPPGGDPLRRLRNRALGALTERVLFRDVAVHERGIRERLGLPMRTVPMLEATISPYLYLQSATPSFEYPRQDLPPSVHWVGPLLPAPGAGPLPGWWDELDGSRPVVLVTQGTVATDLDDLVRPAVEALRDENVLVVVAGADLDPAEQPANVRSAAFVPFGALMPKVDAMVTNGGFGGVQFALAHGVPLVVAGTTEDKPEVAARVAWSGAGIRLRAKRPAPETVRHAVRTVLDDPRHRAAAARISADYATHSAPDEAADLLERLAATGRPVHRGEVARQELQQAVR